MIAIEKKRGRPPNHKPIYCPQTKRTYDTYAEAARDIHGYRNKVYLCANGLQKHHHGFTFIFSERNDTDD